jgi:PEP-CTERM motif
MMKTKYFAPQLIVGVVLLLTSIPASADTVLFGNSQAKTQTLTVTTNSNTFVFTTDMSEFTGGVRNQGWWSATIGNNNTNDNYGVGTVTGGSVNDFFTFDLESFSGGATSAVLSLVTTGTTAVGLPVTYSLFDVSTDAATLNNNTGVNAGIFNDLGSGNLYASLNVNVYPTPTMDITLDAAALADINAASGGFFSIGGTLTPSEAGPVPEPGSLMLLGSGLLGLGQMLRRKIAR